MIAPAICAWCGRETGETETPTGEPSHGICEECCRIHFKEYEEVTMPKKCWYCGKATMEPHDFGDGQKGKRCTGCGATETPKVVAGQTQATTTGHVAQRRDITRNVGRR